METTTAAASDQKGRRNQRLGQPAGRGRGGGGRGKNKGAAAAVYTPTGADNVAKQPPTTAATGTTAGGGGSRNRVTLATTDTGLDAYTLLQSPPTLLSDELMRQFVVDGYLALKPSALPPAFHQNLYARVNELGSRRNDNVGNNILPTIPELALVFEDPVVRGALQSVLGPDYMMHAHRHCHDRRPGARAQEWHKDSYWGFTALRHHYPRWVMAMYYPQDTTLELGPTGLLPGTQYCALPAERERHLTTKQVPPAWGTSPYPATCPAGTVMLIHYDLWHAGLENYSTDASRPRYMFKFQFVRMQEPTAPSWQVGPEGPSPWLPAHSAGKPLTPIYQAVWDWLCGGRGAKTAAEDSGQTPDAVPLFDPSVEGEVQRLAAAYTLARAGLVEPLLQAFDSAEECVARTAAYGLMAAARRQPAAVIEGLEVVLRNQKASQHQKSYAAFALGEAGLFLDDGQRARAVACLNRLREHSRDFSVRRVLAEALGHLGACCASGAVVDEAAVGGLLPMCAEQDPQTRFQAILGLAQAVGGLQPGVLAGQAVHTLANALYDNNRYVQAYALEGLKRMRACPEAQDLLVRILLGQRWCPITTKTSAF